MHEQVVNVEWRIVRVSIYTKCILGGGCWELFPSFRELTEDGQFHWVTRSNYKEGRGVAHEAKGAISEFRGTYRR